MTNNKNDTPNGLKRTVMIAGLTVMKEIVYLFFPPTAFSAAMFLKLNMTYDQIMFSPKGAITQLRLKDVIPSKDEVRIARRTIFR